MLVVLVLDCLFKDFSDPEECIGILQSKTLAKATAWVGISLTVAAAILTMVFGPGNLLGLRLFMATIVGWMLMIGIILLKPKRAGS